MKVVVRRLPLAVTKYVALTKRSPCPCPGERRVEERERRQLTAEDRRFVDRRAVEAAADFRAGLDALGRAEDGDSLLPPLATSLTLTVAISPARSITFVTSSAVKPPS